MRAFRLVVIFVLSLLSPFAMSQQAGGDNWVARASEITLKRQGFGKTVRAVAFAKDVASWKGTVIFSPGAQIPVASMSGLITAVANAGWVVLALDYPAGFAMLQPQAHAIFAQSMQQGFRDQLDLSPRLIQHFEEESPWIIVGHSLGAAILGRTLARTDGLFSRAVLIGASQLIGFKGPVQLPVNLLYGEVDGLIRPAQMKKLAVTLKAGQTIVGGVNHFCITDYPVGNPILRGVDGKVTISRNDCVERMAQALIVVLEQGD